MFRRFVLVCVVVALLQCVNAVIENELVKRTIDVSKHIVREKTQLTIKDEDKAINSYEYILPNRLQGHVSSIEVEMEKRPCEVTALGADDSGLVRYSLNLPEAVPKNTAATLKLTVQYTRVLTPFPAEITQKENQLVVFEDNHLFLSPYSTKSQTTKVKLPSSNVESFSEHKPSVKKGSIITYGPYENVSPLKKDAKSLRVHFLNNSPFLTLTNVVQEIEVSMWGRVSIESVYDLEHTGAKLKGGFSRFDYMHDTPKSSFHTLTAKLPPNSVNEYYRDVIGNITTSRLRQESKHKLFEFTPRFPIFGGWKTQWYMGYSVPTSSVMTRSGKGKYSLKVDFSTSIEGAAVDDLTVKVILPEGTSNVQSVLPFEVDSKEFTKRLTYLDTSFVGRTVLIIKKKNLVPSHNVPFEVTFDFDETFMLLEPGLLVAAFFSIFLLAMIISRLDFSLSSSTSPAKKTKTA